MSLLWNGFCCRNGKAARGLSDGGGRSSSHFKPQETDTNLEDVGGWGNHEENEEWWDEEWWEDDDAADSMLGRPLPADSALTDSVSGTTSVVAANADTVLQTALSTGDVGLADAALGVGLRVSSVAWLAHACSALHDSGIEVRIERALDLVRIYSRESRPDLALDLFWQHRQSSQSLDEELYGAVLEACARCASFALAARVAEAAEWKVPHDSVGQAAMLALVRWMAQQQPEFFQQQAVQCYNAVKEARGGKPDLATHRILMSASVQAGNMQEATVLFHDLLESGLRPDSSAFATLICGHCAAGHVQQALSCFQLMRKHGIDPHVSLFNTILDGCLYQNLPALLEQVLADMEGSGVQPSTDTLAILLRHYGRNEGPEGVKAVMEEFPRQHGLELDAAAYSTLILACLDAGCDDLAWNAFERCRSLSSRSQPTHQACEGLIRSCTLHGHLERAVDLISEIASTANRGSEQTTASSPTRSPQHETPLRGTLLALVEQVLHLIGRRREAKRLGVPLLETLHAAGVELPAELTVALTSQAEAEASGLHSTELHRRQQEWHRWRNLRS